MMLAALALCLCMVRIGNAGANHWQRYTARRVKDERQRINGRHLIIVNEATKAERKTTTSRRAFTSSVSVLPGITPHVEHSGQKTEQTASSEFRATLAPGFTLQVGGVRDVT